MIQVFRLVGRHRRKHLHILLGGPAYNPVSFFLEEEEIGDGSTNENAARGPRNDRHPCGSLRGRLCGTRCQKRHNGMKWFVCRGWNGSWCGNRGVAVGGRRHLRSKERAAAWSGKGCLLVHLHRERASLEKLREISGKGICCGIFPRRLKANTEDSVALVKAHWVCRERRRAFGGRRSGSGWIG